MMYHHSTDAVCLACEDKVKWGAESIQKYWAMVKAEFPDAHLSCVARGEAGQNQAFYDGKSTFKWPDSPHNKVPARAMDLFQVVAGQGVFSPKWYAQVSDFLKLKEAKITWGGDFVRLKDYPHFQLKEEA